MLKWVICYNISNRKELWKFLWFWMVLGGEKQSQLFRIAFCVMRIAKTNLKKQSQNRCQRQKCAGARKYHNLL
jgi:hypothetical protein